MKKILIFGGTSTVGRSLNIALSGSYETITAGRKDCDIIIDLSNPIDNFIIPEDLDAIIHTAAQFGIRTDEQILASENVNVLGTLKLCQIAAREKAKHFIFISSIYSSVPKDSINYNFYSLSKKQAEEVAALYCSMHKIPLTILRPGPLYGNDNGFRVHQPFFYTIIDKAEKGEDIYLYGSKDPIRNYLHIEDLVEITKRVVDGKIVGSYSCTNMSDVTYSQIANLAFAAFNREGKVYFQKDKPDIPDTIFEKEYSLYEKINFYPNISIEKGIQNLVKSRELSK